MYGTLRLVLYKLPCTTVFGNQHDDNLSLVQMQYYHYHFCMFITHENEDDVSEVYGESFLDAGNFFSVRESQVIKNGQQLL